MLPKPQAVVVCFPRASVECVCSEQNIAPVQLILTDELDLEVGPRVTLRIALNEGLGVENSDAELSDRGETDPGNEVEGVVCAARNRINVPQVEEIATTRAGALEIVDDITGRRTGS